MDPIVNGIRKQYADCFTYERVNFHQNSAWHRLIGPLVSPEFALLDDSGKVLYRWFGVLEKEEFDAVLKPLCRG